MDEARLETLGTKPLAAEFARIEAIKSKQDVAATIGHLARIGVNAPFAAQVHQDNKDSTRYIVDLGQAGLGLPDRDYYLDDADVKLSAARAKYRDARRKDDGYGRRSRCDAGRLGDRRPRDRARQGAVDQGRDCATRSRPTTRSSSTKLAALAPGYDWKRYLDSAGIEGKVDYLIVGQPSYITAFAKVLDQTPLPVWKAYFRWQLLSASRPIFRKPYVDANFAFYGTVLRRHAGESAALEARRAARRRFDRRGAGQASTSRSTSRRRTRRAWKRWSAICWPPIGRASTTLDWMSPRPRQKALDKLAKFTPKIGYPNKWRDYSTLSDRADDLVGNVMRANEFEYRRNIAKLGKPIDRDEWGMTPQTVNAYYNPELNEIVFPGGHPAAAVLRRRKPTTRSTTARSAR